MPTQERPERPPHKELRSHLKSTNSSSEQPCCSLNPLLGFDELARPHQRKPDSPRREAGCEGHTHSVELVVDLLAKGWTQEQILDSDPNLTADDIRACLAYASEVLHAERIYPRKTA